MPILSVGVRWCRAIGWVCKPEVTGSISVRSINPCKTELLRCPYRRDRGPTAHSPRGLTPAKPACRRKSPQSLTAGRSWEALTTGNDSHGLFAGIFTGPPTRPSSLIPRTSRTTIDLGVQHRRIEAEDRPKIATALVARRELLASASEARQSRDDRSDPTRTDDILGAITPRLPSLKLTRLVPSGFGSARFCRFLSVW